MPSSETIKQVRRLRNVFADGLLRLEALETQLISEGAREKLKPRTLQQELKDNTERGIWRKPKAFKKTKS